MVKIIIFDADGMVIKRGILPSEQFSKEFGIPLEKITAFFNKEFQLCKVGKADTKEVLKKYLPAWDWKKSVEDFLEYWFKFDSVLNEEMLKSIKDLRAKGIKCCLATNNEKYRVEYFENVLKFKNIFNGVFSTHEIGFSKSQPEFWQAVYEKLSKPDKKSVLCWDNDKEKIESAKSFGFQTEHYVSFDDYKNKIKNYINN